MGERAARRCVDAASSTLGQAHSVRSSAHAAWALLAFASPGSPGFFPMSQISHQPDMPTKELSDMSMFLCSFDTLW
jgi:hypothetical protein